MKGADPDPDLLHLHIDGDPLNNNASNRPNVTGNISDGGDKDSDLDGPTVEAHINLSKIAHKYCILDVTAKIYY